MNTHDYRGQVLRSTKFVGSELAGANFAGATLVDVSFDGADLTGSDFSMAHVEKSSFRGANLSGARMTGTKFSPATSFEGANLENTILSGIDAQYANFDEANLTHTFLLAGDVRHSSFRNAVLDQANLECADFSFGILSGASFIDARFVDASLRNADLSGSNFGGVDLRKSFIGDSIWRGANLQQANLSSLIFGQADIEGCFVQDAILEGCDLSQCLGEPSGEPFIPISEAPVAPIIPVDTYRPVTGLVPVARSVKPTTESQSSVETKPETPKESLQTQYANETSDTPATFAEALGRVIQALVSEAKTFKLRTNHSGAIISPYVQGKLESDGSFSFEASSNKYVNPPMPEESAIELAQLGWSTPIPPELPNFYFKRDSKADKSEIAKVITKTLLDIFHGENTIEVEYKRSVKKYDDALDTPLDIAIQELETMN